MDRRTWLKLAASTAAAAAFPMPAIADVSKFPKLFSEDVLDDFVYNELARRDFVPFRKSVDEALAGLPFDQYNKAAVYKEDQAIWRDDGSPFRLKPYHTAGTYYSHPVDLCSIEGAQWSKIPYSPDAFDFPTLAKRPQIPAKPDFPGYFAGFRAGGQIDKPNVFRDFLSFIGNTNFQAIAANQVFGVSARAFAINTGQTSGEDFPVFLSFFIAKPKPGDRSLTLYGIFDSEHSPGWLKFVVTPGYDTIIDTQVTVIPRRPINYCGFAPIASHFFSGPGVPPKRRDYRPRVHDTEALYIANGAGEQIWRPLLNPERLQFSVFVDKAPKGFGLIQHERSFAAYQDADQQFNIRPSLWIEPVGDWGEGSIDLIELPATEENNENILCFWRPKEALLPLSHYRKSYRMHWCWNPPLENKNATIAQTLVWEPKSGEATFIIDFNLEGCPDCSGSEIGANVTASAGEIRRPWKLAPLPGAGAMQRLRFDFVPGGSEPIDLRAQLVANGKPISDSWIFRWPR
jgi:periplasmic glucans biosynthesis protein